jgi:hypothetical protein
VSTEQSIKIANPGASGASHISRSHAERLIAQHRARFDYAGRLLLGEERGAGGVSDLRVQRFSGLDARPDRAVMPPWPEALARMS